MNRTLVSACLLLVFFGCITETKNPEQKTDIQSVEMKEEAKNKVPFTWDAATIYFLLTDRFNNGNPENDVNFDRRDSTAVLRGFMGGDLRGITQKINDGYFTDLGVNAIWFTPIVEQVHGLVDEGTGPTYGYHGYWAKDWTALDPNFGTKKDLENLVSAAHGKGIRVLMDVVLNHTGPVTDKDPVWPKEWVRTDPVCDFTTYGTTTGCTLVKNLPDILTESNELVELPDQLLSKWKDEGRLSHELDELQLFFERTGYPRAPRFYIIKWLTDYVNDLGIDGFRVDTAKHVDEQAWTELNTEATHAFENWKKMHPDSVLDENPFYMVGEVYGYGISGGRMYDFGDKKVDYFDHGFHSLINFDFKYDAKKDYESIFSMYSKELNTSLKGKSVLNYLSSHDDGDPFDKYRKMPFKSANILLMAPGAAQIYYGDETARSLTYEGAEGDANLRSFMNWEELDSLSLTKNINDHWKKLGRFRAAHPSIGAGKHKRLASKPYVFSRTYVDGEYRDKVVVGLDLPKGKKSLWVKGFFGDGTILHDAYSNTDATVVNGKVLLDNEYETALLEVKEQIEKPSIQ